MKLPTKAVVAFLVWTAVGVLYGFQLYSATGFAGKPIPLFYAIHWQLIEWWAWAFLAPGIFFLARRFYPEGSPASLLLALGVHAAAAGASVLIQPFVVGLLYQIIPWANPEKRTLAEIYLFTLGTHFGFLALTYAKILAVALVIDFYRRFQQGSARAAELERQLAEARLQTLQTQLQPHFLFNTLNAIASLVRSDPGQAERMISRLGDLLRATLTRSDRLEVTLAEEWEFTRRYLEIEQVRFSDRLTVRVEIDPAVLDAQVPALLLQPLVENAIRHGIARRAEPGEIVIAGRAVQNGEALEISVSDNGAGLDSGSPAGSGVGLENTRKRLAQLYGAERATLELSPAPMRGARVTIRLPRRVEVPKDACAGEVSAAPWVPGRAALTPHA